MSAPIGMYAPIGWASPLVPGSATVTCGQSLQDVNYTSFGSTPLGIGFAVPSSWSNTFDLTPDASGANWTCSKAGVYLLNVSQNLTVHNTADATNPVVDLIVTATTTDTSEFNTVLINSLMVPITLSPININVSVSGYLNLDTSSSLTVSLVSKSGNVSIVSGYNALPSPTGTFQWNLVAEGPKGNVGVIVP